MRQRSQNDAGYIASAAELIEASEFRSMDGVEIEDQEASVQTVYVPD